MAGPLCPLRSRAQGPLLTATKIGLPAENLERWAQVAVSPAGPFPAIHSGSVARASTLPLHSAARRRGLVGAEKLDRTFDLALRARS